MIMVLAQIRHIKLLLLLPFFLSIMIPTVYFSTQFEHPSIVSSYYRYQPKRPLCQNRRLLIGPLNVTFEAPTFEEIAKRNPKLRPGGQYRPKRCKSKQLERIAIIIPYRSRETQLRALLNHLHPVLQRQQLHYTIIVVEQAGNDTFNKALLMNIAFNETRDEFGCFIFHDVDMFTEDDRGIYYCADNPVHISEYINKYMYKSWHIFWGGTDILVGGILALRRNIFESVNGYSNVFFGWGGEDDDMRKRLRGSNIPILLPNKEFYRFKMIWHERDVGNPDDENGLRLVWHGLARQPIDGLNSLHYKLLSRDLLPTHTRLLVSFNREEVFQAVYGDPIPKLEKFEPNI